MPRMTADEMALELMLAGDDVGLARLRERVTENKVECPECGDMGPHDDNGCTGANLSYCCSNCGNHFDAEQV